MQPAARRARWRISAGLVDAALASLATFACGLFAGRYLEAADLGAYAVVFAAFVVAAIIPSQLLFTPCEVEAVRLTEGSRLRMLWTSMRLGTPLALLSAVGLVSVVWALPGTLQPDTVAALVTTAVAAAFLSPCQDHLRRMFHVDGASWLAAAVSGVHCAVIVTALVLAGRAGIAPAWIPFGALTVGNALSFGVGLLLALIVRPSSAQRPPSYRLRDLLSAGSWLVLVGLLPNGAAFVGVAVVAHLAGTAAVGHAEAARLVAQPLFVFSVGLAAVLGPQSTAAAQRLAADDARRLSWQFRTWLVSTGLLFGLWVSLSWAGNPFATLLPNAYAVSWLVPLSVLANILNGMAFPQRAELLGAGQTRALAAVEAIGSVLRAGVAATATVTTAFAIPAGLGLLGVCRSYGYAKPLRKHYRAAGVSHVRAAG